MFLSNFGLTLNFEVRYPTVELIYVFDDFAFLESMSFFCGGRGLSILRAVEYVYRK